MAIALSVGACLAEPSPRPSAPPRPSATSTTRPAPAGSAGASDSIEPAPLEEPEPSAAGEPIVVVIRHDWGSLRVTVLSDGLVTKARPATDHEDERVGGLNGDRLIATTRIGDDLLVAWMGGCDRSARLIVLPDQVFVGPAPRQGCDSLGVGYGVVLSTAVALDPSNILARLAPTVLIP
jgi:hypothetical protein